MGFCHAHTHTCAHTPPRMHTDHIRSRWARPTTRGTLTGGPRIKLGGGAQEAREGESPVASWSLSSNSEASFHSPGPPTVREKSEAGTGVGRPLPCLSVESVLNRDKAATCKDGCGGRGGRALGLVCGMGGERCPPVGVSRVQSSWAEAGVDSGIRVMESSLGGLAGSLHGGRRVK